MPKKRVCEMLKREADAGFPGFYVDLEEMREWMLQRIEQKTPSRSAGVPTRTRR
jgi:hypothetical protein